MADNVKIRHQLSKVNPMNRTIRASILLGLIAGCGPSTGDLSGDAAAAPVRDLPDSSSREGT